MLERREEGIESVCSRGAQPCSSGRRAASRCGGRDAWGRATEVGAQQAKKGQGTKIWGTKKGTIWKGGRDRRRGGKKEARSRPNPEPSWRGGGVQRRGRGGAASLTLAHHRRAAEQAVSPFFPTQPVCVPRCATHSTSKQASLLCVS